jgi:hypothetical protein
MDRDCSNYGDTKFTARRSAVREAVWKPSPFPTFSACAPKRISSASSTRFAPSSPRRKNIVVIARPKSALKPSPSRPARGAYRDRHGRWAGMRWTRKRRARGLDRRAVLRTVSDLSAPDERRFGGRQNRVVLAPVAGVKSAEVLVSPTGSGEAIQSADDGDKTNSSPGRARHKPLKPSACGNAGLIR